jgi:glycosyltransferase involved in cell wall biosynthesis
VFILLQQNNVINQARWPNKCGDYFAAGRMILANRVGDIAGLMDQYPEGFLEVEFDKDSVKESIIKMISSKSELLKKGYSNRQVAEEVLSWKIITENLLNFYKKIIEIKNNSN